MNKGFMSPGHINMLASQTGNDYARMVKNLQSQGAERARAGGYQMPWLMGGAQNTTAAPQTLANFREAANTRNNLMVQNMGQQMNAAGQLGNLAGVLSSIAMQPTQQSQAPQYVPDAMNAYNTWMGNANNFLTGLGDQFKNLNLTGSSSSTPNFGNIPSWVMQLISGGAGTTLY